jgi:2,3-bisphosphoglycerate-independent phosphoglycerate mutase
MQKLIKPLIQKNNSRIVLVVLDGLGGLPLNGRTELEAARTPNLDALAARSACGLHVPVAYGITPGSGPGHLGLFGYDPVEYRIGRGVLEALGLGLEVRRTDVAVRCNYATLRDEVITDRRAERIPTEQSKRLTEKLRKEISRIDGVELIFAPGMEHRFAVVMRFPRPLTPEAAMISDTDPQIEGKPPLNALPLSKDAEEVAEIADRFVRAARKVLENEGKANYLLLRGFSGMPHVPTFEEAFGLRAVAIATYPMYRGLARIVGMDTPALEGSVEDEIRFLKHQYGDYDFFFLHVKKPDSCGEDGNFQGKTARIEEFDALLPEILSLNPDVLVITGDHSTPSVMKGHSWHPVPLLLSSPYVLGGLCASFSERECVRGELGIFPAVNILPLALANAGRLKKFGA